MGADDRCLNNQLLHCVDSMATCSEPVVDVLVQKEQDSRVCFPVNILKVTARIYRSHVYPFERT